MKKQKHWYDYLWVVTPIYLALGFFNIMFAWLGMIFFMLPLLIAIFGGGKLYCNRYCDRGQFLSMLGGKIKRWGNRPTPAWMRSNGFRYGFLIFFFVMFFQMLWTTYLVGAGAQNLKEFVTLFWTFRLPWHWAYHGTGLPVWAAQFAFGFYSMMLTSTLIGVLVMLLYKPRTWCVFCPMGTMTQLISRLHIQGQCSCQTGLKCSGGMCSKKEDVYAGESRTTCTDYDPIGQ